MLLQILQPQSNTMYCFGSGDTKLKIPQEKAENWKAKIHKYGDGFAFFSFLPGVGDFIAVAAGLLRCRWWVVLVSMAVGKLVRYLVWMEANQMIIN